MNITTLSPSSPRSLQVTTGGQLNGNLAVSGVTNVIGSLTPTTGYGLHVRPALTGNTFQIGVYSNPTFDSGATSWGAAIYAKGSTVAGSYTLNNVMTVAIASPGPGAGVTITSQYGLYIYNQGSSQVANAYGIFIAAPTGATSSNTGLYNQGTTSLYGTLYCNAPAQFTQNVSIGNQPVYTTVGLNMVVNLSGQGVSGVGADQVCQKIVGVFSSAATSGMGLYFQPTSGSSNNFSSIWAFYIDGSNIGTSPCASYYGLYIQNQGKTSITNSYGIWIEPQSGSSSQSTPIYVNQSAGTATPYKMSLILNNSNTGTGTGAFIRFSVGASGGGAPVWGTSIGTIQNAWWVAIADRDGVVALGWDSGSPQRWRLASDTGWVTPSFLNGYTSYSTPYATGYRKFADGQVQLRGLINAPASAGTSAFQLPAGYRPGPNMTYLFTQITSFGIIRVDVQADGNVVCGIEVRVGTWANGGWISLDGCIFLAEQ